MSLDGFLARCQFPGPGDGPCWLAVSGGADSLALVVLAAAAGIGGTVVHVDHGLRAGSAGEAGPVAATARRFGFSFEARRVDVPPGPDLEARARSARYAALPPGVLTGHTMDDQAETVLLNIVRGAALDGLAGMRSPTAASAARIPRRPLLGLRRAETAGICSAAGLTPFVDPGNSDSRFRRNRVRSEVIPLLNAVAQRDVVPVLARQATVVADDVELLEALAADVDPTDVHQLRQAPSPLARRALRRWLREGDTSGERHPPSHAELLRVLEVVAGRATACELAGGRRVWRRSGRLSVAPAAAGIAPL